MPVDQASNQYVYQGKVVKVSDGDTIEVSIKGWPAPFNPVAIRVDGIDTPESRMPPAKCDKEVRLGLIAKKWAKDNLPVNTMVTVIWSQKKEKYGRLLANVILPNGKDFAQEQIKSGNAREYHGETKSDWCK